MREKLRLPCEFEHGDALHVDVSEDGFGNPTIQISAVTNDDCGVIHLDKDSARKLFNWLGLWLHEYRSDG